MAVEFFIGWRYLKAKRRQALISLISLISLVGVALGVAALTVVLAVMSGSQEELRRKVMGVNPHILLMRYGQPLEDHRAAAAEAGRVTGVVSVEPFIYHQVMFTGQGGVAGGVLRGVDPALAERHGNIGPMITQGRLADLAAEATDGREPGIILGTELAKTLGVGLGDGVRVVTPSGGHSKYAGTAPRSRVFRVVGLVRSGLYDYDTTLAYIGLEPAQDFLDLGQDVTGLEVRVQDVYAADRVREALLENLGPGFWGRDWMQMNRNIFAALKLQKTVLFLILSLTVLVAAFNIVSSLTMVVMEKTKEIAILKSMGATRWLVMKIFMTQGLFLGLSGTAAGLAIGLALSELLTFYQPVRLPEGVYFFDRLPVKLQALDLGLVSISAVLICFAATLYPAWRASRLNPVEAIRYE
jgi:lipoprotein-releasing system permease protein